MLFKNSVNTKSVFISIGILSVSAFVLTVGFTKAIFTDKIQISGVSFSTGDWILPESEIKGLYNTQELSAITNLNNFRVEYGANDIGAGIDYVELWYSHNQNDWRFYDSEQPNSSGSFQFDCPDGDGFYDFQVLAFDKKGNQEDKDFETGFETIFVDTQPPETTLITSGGQLILISDDNFGSGVFKIYYSINGGDVQSSYGSQIDITSQLQSDEDPIEYFSEDTAGNFEVDNLTSYSFE